MQTEVIEFESAKTGESVQAVYEHPWPVRFSHWVNSVALFVLVGSGLQIFRAFPSFGDKIPQKDLLNWPKAFAIGGWLGGALQWHLTFMWIYIATGLFYLGYQMFSLNYRQACRHRHLQSAAETGLYVCDWTGRFVGVDRLRCMEASSVFLAGLVDGWLSPGASVAFRRDVGNSLFSPRALGHGCDPWLEQLRVNVHRMEDGSGLHPPLIRFSGLLRKYRWGVRPKE